MRILALETSGLAGSVAVLEGDQLLVEIELDPVRRTAQTLAPALQAVLQQVGWQPADINLVAVTSGPGSFTGLRIGVTTAKTFAYATGAEVVGVNTLAVIARSVSPEQVTAGDGFLWAVMNAEREQLFVAPFRFQGSAWVEVEPTAIVDSQVWLNRLGSGAAVCGSGLKNIVARIPPGITIVSELERTPRASHVGHEGIRAVREGRVSDCWSLLPNYFRESAAVEKAKSLHP